MHRSTGTDTPLLLFLPSVPSGAAAETGPTKVVCERSCKIEGWRGKERRRDGRRLLEAERGKREKKRSLVLVPSPHSLPSPPRGEKTSPALTAALGGRSPAAPAMPWPPHRDGHRHKPVTTDPADACHGQAPSLAFQTQPLGSPALANQLLLPGILISSPASCIPVHPVASIILPRGLRGGSPPPSNPPEILGGLQAAAPEAHSLVGLVCAAEADSAITLIERGTRSREQLPVAYVLGRHLLLLLRALIKANAVMVTLLFNRFFQWLAWKKRKAIKEKAEIDRCAEPGRASHGVRQGCRGLARVLGSMQEGWLLQEVPSRLRKGAVQML